uniref:Isochorismatase domain-containing protein 1 n=1 Tax=Panagrolaimus superbus TaxID=310955 RepID=A0A914Y3J1_9BILA
MATRLLQRVNSKQAALFVCDLQEKFSKNIKYFPEIVQVTRRLIQASTILDVPIIATEQYPKGLGHLVPELGIKELNIPVYDKTCFSMCANDIMSDLEKRQIHEIILCGIEAHVCIYQTCLDLLNRGYTVHVVADACSSRSMTDRIVALKTLQQAGAYLTTSESMILGLVGGSDHPKFKEIQKIIMESAPDTGLLAHL